MAATMEIDMSKEQIIKPRAPSTWTSLRPWQTSPNSSSPNHLMRSDLWSDGWKSNSATYSNPLIKFEICLAIANASSLFTDWQSSFEWTKGHWSLKSSWRKRPISSGKNLFMAGSFTSCKIRNKRTNFEWHYRIDRDEIVTFELKNLNKFKKMVENKE